MERSNLTRWIYVCLAIGSWAFLLLALGSFHPTDWPSHAVHPYPPIQNMCGPVGAFIAYYLFLIIGQGAFPMLFFSGVCVVLFVAHNRVSDPWMRAIGLLLLSIAFAAAVHHFKPGSENGFPEGQGGVLGIGAASFLQAHFSTAGTRLVLLTAILIGMLLAADDLVLRAPVFVGAAVVTAKHATSTFDLKKLPSLSRMGAAGKDAAKGGAPVQRITKPDEDPEDLKSPVMLRPWSNWLSRSKKDDVELTYENDEPHTPAAADAAFIDAADPAPAAHALIPPPPPVTPEIPVTPMAPAIAETSADAAAAPAPIEPPVQRKDIIVKLPSMLKPRQVSPPPPPPKELGEYHLPQWDMLEDAEHGYAESQEAFVREKAAVLEQALKEFDVEAHVVEIDTGPVITMYELALAAGVKVSAISALSNDIQRALRAETIRIVAPIPGKSTVGIEVPNEQKELV
ncbi:MAG TPA: DNA translocase FtsK 4TM domain-containing protein, partial [Tepidisphaeraceae bacterium]|nr:DNA translocase FtsK 4TM domain-containing protein [Tepidisphaeraceae bacterium]